MKKKARTPLPKRLIATINMQAAFSLSPAFDIKMFFLTFLILMVLTIKSLTQTTTDSQKHLFYSYFHFHMWREDNVKAKATCTCICIGPALYVWEMLSFLAVSAFLHSFLSYFCLK